MNGEFVYVNDQFVPAGQAVLHYSDLAIQRGYGIFDFFRVTRGRAVFLDHHLDRFYHSAGRMRLEVGKSREELKGVLAELLRRNGLAESGVRINLTGGYSEDAYSIGRPNLVITQRALPGVGDLLERGLKLVTYEHRRQIADVKTLDYLMAIWLQPFVKGRGADDVLYQQGGVVSECPRSNFFIVGADGRIRTPGEHVLKGVVRGHVLRIAGGRFDAGEGPVRVEEIAGAREAFITSTTKGPVPVVAVDGRAVGNGRPGEVTRWVMEEFGKLLADSV
jgi:D-alanine transaminase/branched-chain amino acid aminotransferase